MAGYIDHKIHDLDDMLKIEFDMSVVVDRHGDVWTFAHGGWVHPSWDQEVRSSPALLEERGPLQLVWTKKSLAVTF